MADGYIDIPENEAPRVFERFVTEANGDLRKKINNHCGEEWPIHGIKCSCGNRVLKIMSDGLDESEYLGSIIVISCDSCGKKYELFNSQTQGYDGELGNCGEYEVEDNELHFLKCKKCKSESFELAVGFEYAIDEDEADDFDKDLKDLYTWLFGSVKCYNCNTIEIVIDHECA